MRVVRTLLETLGFFLLVAVATIFSGSASVVGAQAAGWQPSQWAIMIPFPLVFGLIAGLILSILSFVFLLSTRGYREALIAGLVCPIVVTFVAAFIIYFIALFPQRHAKQQYAEPNTSGIQMSGSAVAPSTVEQ
jgi:hypothetical protein